MAKPDYDCCIWIGDTDTIYEGGHLLGHGDFVRYPEWNEDAYQWCLANFSSAFELGEHEPYLYCSERDAVLFSLRWK